MLTKTGELIVISTIVVEQVPAHLTIFGEDDILEEDHD